ncbi:uncharacterized protein LOC106875693 [Octopus bimaculoides]|uniref:uncharacterized protein LOC106875693 n=1 Tax=Octopus bimaculoides TaxID=37653 RepID=UPI0022E70883|nr:uncharacterized protein LOC106875693 [Octopus bimaculoides]
MISLLGNNIGFLCTAVFGLLTTIHVVHAMISCSSCDSRRDKYYGECEQSPPPPKPCPKSSNSHFCSIIRETEISGTPVRFARDCADKYIEEDCVVKNITAARKTTYCIRTCDTDGCNAQGLEMRGGSSKLNIFTYLVFGLALLLNIQQLAFV